MHRVTALLLCSLMAAALPMEAKSKEIRVSWQQLSSEIQGKKISLTLPDGSQAKGRVKSVEADKLVLETRRGDTSIPRSSIKTLTTPRSGWRGKAIGTAVGLGIGIALAVPVNTYAHNEGDGAPLIVAAIVIVPTLLGLWAGYAADRGAMTIVVD